jgi:hypothetical protein
MPARRRDVVRAMLLCAGLTIVHSWPVGALPWSVSLMWHGDAQLNGWIVSWIPHALITDPVHLFDGNIFAPERNTLAYSEPLIVPAVIGAPLTWMGVPPAVVLNVLTAIGLFLTALAGGFVTWRWTGSIAAGVVGGALIAFNVHLLTRVAHLAAIHAWGLPLTLYYADALVDRPDRRTIVGLAVVIAAVAATSLYWLALAGLIAGLTVVVGARTRRAWGAAMIAGLSGLALAAPVLLPYLRLAAGGAVRAIEAVAEFSATPAGYLVSTSRLHRLLGARVDNEVDVWFAGLAALALAAIGVVAGARRSAVDRRRIVTLGLIAATGVLLSLGPATPVYRALYDVFPPLHGLRAAARFGFLYLLAVGVAGGYGVCAMERSLARYERSRVRGSVVPIRLVSLILLVIVTAEAWHGPVRTDSFEQQPAIYRLLRDEPGPVVLVEAPFYPAHAAFENGEYVLNSTMHFLPLMNGYSGYTPMSYRRRAETFWYFPRPHAVEAMRAEGATHVMVHLRRFGAESKEVEATLAERGDLQLLATDPAGRRLYRFR